MDLEGKLQQVKERYEEITQAMADPAIYDRPKEYAELTKEHTQLKELVEDFDEWQSITNQISGNEELIEMDDDAEITEMAREEIKELKQRLKELEEEIKMKLIPKDLSVWCVANRNKYSLQIVLGNFISFNIFKRNSCDFWHWTFSISHNFINYRIPYNFNFWVRE